MRSGMKTHTKCQVHSKCAYRHPSLSPLLDPCLRGLAAPEKIKLEYRHLNNKHYLKTVCVKNKKAATRKIEIEDKFSKTVEGKIGTKTIWSILKCKHIKKRN